MFELPTRNAVEVHFWTALLNQVQLSCPRASINGRKKRTECCGSFILKVIRMLGDIWKKSIGCGLREEAGINASVKEGSIAIAEKSKHKRNERNSRTCQQCNI